MYTPTPGNSQLEESMFELTVSFHPKPLQCIGLWQMIGLMTVKQDL
jgi:hypothetical protein